ncbi:hypothetical protein OG756_06155 [Streptomyces sp. NBC_01310]|uniref:hypothetical protein n=1 Tax=unclassified Streptomyces TaxID=2593676 RepID=UPI0035B62D08|nr:hypothetical protein OG756_06155 [Streptomyces sp. NBC_01310]
MDVVVHLTRVVFVGYAVPVEGDDHHQIVAVLQKRLETTRVVVPERLALIGRGVLHAADAHRRGVVGHGFVSKAVLGSSSNWHALAGASAACATVGPGSVASNATERASAIRRIPANHCVRETRLGLEGYEAKVFLLLIAVAEANRRPLPLIT